MKMRYPYIVARLRKDSCIAKKKPGEYQCVHLKNAYEKCVEKQASSQLLVERRARMSRNKTRINAPAKRAEKGES